MILSAAFQQKSDREEFSTESINFRFEKNYPMLKVYLSQFSIITEGQFVLLPYSAGLLLSYAKTSQSILENYDLSADIFFIPDELEEVLKKITDPAVFGFSTYVWNSNYSDKLASLVKARYPDCLIIYGGPQVPDDASQMFECKPWVDIAVHQEGEIAFSAILEENLKGRDWSNIEGITYRDATDRSKVTSIGSRRIKDLSILPSPYLDGTFDGYVERYSSWTINSILESNRGCPFKCTFCDWGSATFSKLAKFDLDRVVQEIEWAGENQIDCVVNADSNFGIFKDRDARIATELAKAKEKFGWPRLFTTNWTKNNNSIALDIAVILKHAGLLRKFAISLQSLNQETLEAIERSNLKSNDFENIVNLAKEKDISVMVELIMNLPGETYESWVENYSRLLKYENLYIDSYPLSILSNSEMNREEYREAHGIKTATVTLPFSKIIEEKEEMVIATSTMNEEQAERAWLFTWLARTMHTQGFLFFAANYVIKTLGIDHRKFYDELLEDLLQTDGMIREILFKQQELIGKKSFVEFYYTNWWVEDIGEKRRAEFYGEIESYLHTKYPTIDSATILRFQNVACFNPNESYPLEIALPSNPRTGETGEAAFRLSHPGIGVHRSYKSYISLSRSTRWMAAIEQINL